MKSKDKTDGSRAANFTYKRETKMLHTHHGASYC